MNKTKKKKLNFRST